MMQGDYVDLLVQKQTATVAVIQKLRLAYKLDAKDIYVLHEGRDDRPFYTELLPRVAKKTRFVLLPAGNKDAVIKVHHALKDDSLIDKRRVVFIVDRDYGNLVPQKLVPDSPEIYVTDYYSVESHFADRSALAAIFGKVIGIPEYEAIFASIIDRCEAAVHDFAKAMLPTAANVISRLRARQNVDQSLIRLGKAFSIDDKLRFQKIARSRGASISECVKDLDPVPFVDVLKTARQMQNLDYRMWIRGKYLEWFIRKAIRNSSSMAQLTIDPKRSQFTFDATPLEKSGLYLWVGRYIDAPKSLQKYLKLRGIV